MANERAKAAFDDFCRSYFHRDAFDKFKALVTQDGVPAAAVRAVGDALWAKAEAAELARLDEQIAELQARRTEVENYDPNA